MKTQGPNAISIKLTPAEASALLYLRNLPGGWQAAYELRKLIVEKARENGWRWD